MKRFWISLLAFAALTVVIFLFFGAGIDAWTLAALGDYSRDGLAFGVVFALLLFALLAVDIIFPVPATLLAATAGAVFGPVIGGLIATGGLTAGSLGGFFAAQCLLARGLSGADHTRLRRSLDRIGPFLLILLRPVPVLAEASVLAAGANQMAPRRAVAALLLGNCAVGFGYALAGKALIEGAGGLWVMGLSMVVPALAYLGWQMAFARRVPRTATR